MNNELLVQIEKLVALSELRILISSKVEFIDSKILKRKFGFLRCNIVDIGVEASNKRTISLDGFLTPVLEMIYDSNTNNTYLVVESNQIYSLQIEWGVPRKKQYIFLCKGDFTEHYDFIVGERLRISQPSFGILTGEQYKERVLVNLQEGSDEK